MSYDIAIFHPTVRQRVEAGEELDGFPHPNLEPEAVTRFTDRLLRYQYTIESTTENSQRFVKYCQEVPIQVGVYASEISFSVPYWENADDAIFTALQDAAEMLEPEQMALFNPQDGEWLDF